MSYVGGGTAPGRQVRFQKKKVPPKNRVRVLAATSVAVMAELGMRTPGQPPRRRLPSLRILSNTRSFFQPDGKRDCTVPAARPSTRNCALAGEQRAGGGKMAITGHNKRATPNQRPGYSDFGDQKRGGWLKRKNYGQKHNPSSGKLHSNARPEGFRVSLGTNTTGFGPQARTRGRAKPSPGREWRI